MWSGQYLGALLVKAKSTVESDIVCMVRLWKINSSSLGSSGLQLPRSVIGDIERRQKPVYCRCCESTFIDGARRLGVATDPAWVCLGTGDPL